ncbi:MAG: NAD(+) synthase [Verrucomicrobia bacterium]|jgi:NAD+ synthase (glutamine-hydrolysing)|nr:NAD(+) synthase [Verrucomicrobiota bacterium]
MSPHTLKTRLAQIEVLPGQPRENTNTILEHIAEAIRDGIELLVFPEMAVPGYLLGDTWEQQAFLRQCEACGHEIRRASQGLIVTFGNVAVDWSRRNEDGRVRKYNAIFVAENGEFVSPENGRYPFGIKALLPNYRQFDDSRHFFDLRKLAFEEHTSVQELLTPFHTTKATLGCILCEDAWDMDYAISPIAILAARPEVDLFINASASPFTLNKNHKRTRVFAAHARKLGRPLLYVNKVGIQNNGKTVFTFDGASCAYDAEGNFARCGDAFEATTLTLNLPLGHGATFADHVEPREDTIADMHAALTYGTRRFMKLCGLERAVIGVSGGIDSAVVAAIHAQILPPENLLLVNMPSRFNSNTTKSLARALAENAGCFYADIPIEASVDLTRSQIDGLAIQSVDGTRKQTLALTDFMQENVQARDRSSRILAALASSFGGAFTCNANKSEITVGYTTLYGDLGGYLACIADLWKTQVYALADYLNAEVFGRELIPRGSIDIVPSAELSHDHNVDEGKGDPLDYPYHDVLFKSWVEWWDRATPEDILGWYADGVLESKLGYNGCIANAFPNPQAFIADLERWWNLYQGMGLAKRIQAPPILALKRRAFGFDHRESQMGPLYTDAYEAMKNALLDRG